MMRTAILSFVLVFFVATAAARAEEPARWQPLDEHWYVLEMDGSQVGWMSSASETDGTRYRTTTATAMRFGRGAAPVDIELKSVFLETHDGKPLGMEFVQSMALQPLETRWTFAEDHVDQVSVQGGRTIESRLPLPEGNWLTPMAVKRAITTAIAEGKREIGYSTISGESGLDSVEIRHLYVKDQVQEVDGKPAPVTVWRTTNSLIEGIEAMETYASGGLLLREEVRMPMLGTMTTRLATKDEAMREAAAPELLVKTFVRPSRPIRNADRAKTATLRLRATEGAMPQLPSAGAQRVVQDGETATLTIDLDDPVPAAEGAAGEYRAATALIDAGDPLILALSASAVRDAGADPRQRALAARESVHRLLTDAGLDTVFATASETARTRAGDCSEHAVLLCALLRADDIPARVAVGLVYADAFLGERDIFGWHMWTQALIDGRWIDLDATLPDRYHAAHVLTSTTGLDDNVLGAEMAATLLLMGNLEIEVVDVGYE